MYSSKRGFWERGSFQIKRRVDFPFKCANVYSVVINSIRTVQLELVENLTENHLQLLDTLHSLDPSIILQDVLPVIATVP